MKFHYAKFISIISNVVNLKKKKLKKDKVSTFTIIISDLIYINIK